MDSAISPSRQSGGKRISERTVLWGLGIGLALVMVLLGLAAVVAVRDSRQIRMSAAGLARDQILIARLLHEVQAEEDALALALHRLGIEAGEAGRRACVEELSQADMAVRRLAAQASNTQDASRWSSLAKASGQFSERVRQAFASGQAVSNETMERLFTDHENVVRHIHDLILSSSERLIDMDAKMSAQLQELADESALLLGACFILAALTAVATVIYVRRSVLRIRWQSDELDRVSWHMLRSQEEAARRFSHELHDELGQSLAALRSTLGHEGEDWPERRNDALQLVDESIANVRELSQLLRPVILDDFGLEAGLRWLVDKFSQRTRLQVLVDTDCPGRFADETETHLFRIAQEALTNIARHAQASVVRVRLWRQALQIGLLIEDNGRGMRTAQFHERNGSLGMVGMRARARQCGGELEISEPPGGGLRVEVRVPLDPAFCASLERDSSVPLAQP
jgi:signal transduction histidine kinase